MFGATEHILSSSLSHSAGPRCVVRAKMAGSWAVRIPVHDRSWDGLVSHGPLLQPSAPAPAPSCQLRATEGYLIYQATPSSPWLLLLSGPATWAGAGLALDTRRTEC